LHACRPSIKPFDMATRLSSASSIHLYTHTYVVLDTLEL
jgi:hypothetical protein